MSNQHLIALDLDGTLLTDDKKITERTKKVIQSLRDEGHLFVIATGRPHRASIMYYNEMNFDTPMVNFNGAFVHHPLLKNWGEYHEPLDLHTAKTIIEACDNLNAKNILAEVIDDVYLHRHDNDFINIFKTGNPTIKTGHLLDLLLHDPTALLIHSEEHTIDQLRNHLSDVHAEVIDHRIWATPWNVIEIVKSGLNKAVGLEKIANHYQIPRDRIIAFGDEDNDFEMIEYAGKGVSMGNGIAQLKTLANDVTLTNEEEGIATYLEEYFNLKK